MNVETLSRLIRTSGKTKRQIAAECGISRVTLDAVIASGDMKVSTLEAIAASVGVWPGALFDDPAGFVSQTGGQNNVHGDNVRTDGAAPSDLLALLETRDRQVERLIALLESALGKSSATPTDAPANG